ncbi:MAG: HAMP domain-containing sensor histidine kinase [Nitrospirota bacterium]
MKTKIFFAFLVIIAAALFSNFVFEWLIMKDFDNYVKGVKEDQLYWILASVEGSYSNGEWDTAALSESIHWAMMMGIDIQVLNAEGQEVISSQHALHSLSESMKRRMEGLFHIHETGGQYTPYPLYLQGKKIGTLLARPFQKETIKEKEFIFKRRTKNFIYISLAIAGGGSLLLALLLSQYLSKPITTLKNAAEKIANRDFSVRVTARSSGEVEKLTETFNTMAESLEREEQLRKHLMHNIAHELRTPLTIMKTHIEALMDGVIDNCSKGLETLHNETERLITLVKGIEDITSAEASFFTKRETTEVNLREFLSGIVTEMLPLFREKGLGLSLLKEHEIVVVTEVEKLERIVLNVLSNALKYTDKGGTWIDYGIEGGSFYIEIKDSGKGIPERELPHIFTRFHRVEGAGHDGLGLGLAIVKELVTVMGGSVEVASTLNEGTTFRINLPL